MTVIQKPDATSECYPVTLQVFNMQMPSSLASKLASPTTVCEQDRCE